MYIIFSLKMFKRGRISLQIPTQGLKMLLLTCGYFHRSSIKAATLCDVQRIFCRDSNPDLMPAGSCSDHQASIFFSLGARSRIFRRSEETASSEQKKSSNLNVFSKVINHHWANPAIMCEALIWPKH
jgi:hypothetical protein